MGFVKQTKCPSSLIRWDSDFTTVDISGSGYRAHDVAVPSRSYSRDVVSISDQRLKRCVIRRIWLAAVASHTI